MSWKKIRLPLLAVLAMLSITTAVLDHQGLLFGNKNDQLQPEIAIVDDIINSPVATASAIPSTKGTSKPSIKPKSTNKPTASSTNSSLNSNQNTSSSSDNTGGGQFSNPTTVTTPSSTQAPIYPTTTPTATPIFTQTPEPVNVQIWVLGWWYSENGHQYSADGEVKIYNGSTLVASGFYNSYEERYKATNLPTNANLSVYFYMSGCGQVKNVSTGNVSALHQLDFHFNKSTTCL